MPKILKKSLRSLSNVWLIGPSKYRLSAVIPTYHDLLLRFFYEHENNENNIRKSILIIYEELLKILKLLQQTIPDKSNFVRCIKSFVKKYNLLKKNRNKKTVIQKQKQKDFLSAINRQYFVTKRQEESISSESGGELEEDSGIFSHIFYFLCCKIAINYVIILR